MKTNKTIMAVFALGMIALLGTGMVLAYQGNPDVQGPDYSEDRHVAMEEAFDNLDYDAWSQLMSENQHRGKVMDFVTEENFILFAEARNAMQQGDFELAKELKAELGLGQGKMLRGEGNVEGMNGQGMKQGSFKQMNKGMNGACPYAN